jgi:acetyl-CoA synthetase
MIKPNASRKWRLTRGRFGAQWNRDALRREAVMTDVAGAWGGGELLAWRAAWRRSVEQPGEWWSEQARRVPWEQPFVEVVREDLRQGRVEWFPGGRLNACRAALDAQVAAGRGGVTALRFVGPSGEARARTYTALLAEVERTAAALAAAGLSSGDRLGLYLPDCPEAVVFSLAGARLGLTLVPIPHRFPASTAAECLRDCGARLVVVASETGRTAYEERAASLAGLRGDWSAVVVGEFDQQWAGFQPLARFLQAVPVGARVAPVPVEAEHPLFLLYAKAMTGIPRGSVFATGGFVVQAAASFDALFSPAAGQDATPALFCAVDLATSAGQAYGTWGPLVCGRTLVLSASLQAPHAPRFRAVLAHEPRAALLATPRLLAALRRELADVPLDPGARFVQVGVCGDVLAPRLVAWAGQTLTNGASRVCNLWTQSEAGVALIACGPAAEVNRAGALGLACLGVAPLVLNEVGQQCRVNQSGQLCFAHSWPAMIRGIWNQPERFHALHLRRLPGRYCTNDGVRADADGFFWFMGRLDDVLKVAGQSLATSDVEHVLAAHERVAEVAVVGIAREEGGLLTAFVVPRGGEPDADPTESNRALGAELGRLLAERIGDFGVPCDFVFARELPRTASGKVVRRILRRIAVGDVTADEDLSHVSNPAVVHELIRGKGA